MMVIESLDNCDGSEWDAVEGDKAKDKGNGDTSLVNTGGKDFSDYFLSELLSDFKITCEDVTFNCHKIILANGSPVFEAAINSDMLEAKSGCLEIEDCKPSVVKFILEFICVEESTAILHESCSQTAFYFECMLMLSETSYVL